ncbi:MULTISPECIES: ABC transporter substrate-binding protein [unclassified Caballeronia]|jgi:multiple sugar transport system substrate-binding protein|uniref:ABC transporter substrate-binding protein n=1 Tax=unclassified Caballeronia TaxID=2646786 RepID=UPI003ECE3A73
MSVDRRHFLKAVGSSLAVPLAASLPAAVRAQAPVEIVIWQWIPKFSDQVDLFNKSQSRIRVVTAPVTNSADQSLKLRNALAAHSGGPDIAMLEYAHLPALNTVNAFLDITQDVADVRGQFVPSAISQCTVNGKTLGLPLDVAPMIQMYRADILGDWGINAPTTWDEFAAAAEKVRTKSSNQYLTNMFLTSAGWTTGMIWQRGARGFEIDGDKISINLNGAPSKSFSDYWQRLIDAKLVSTEPDSTADFFQALDTGRYLQVMAGCWFPNYARTNANKSFGKWRVAKMPHLSAQNTLSTAFGGSMFGVFSGTKHPKESLEVIRYMMSNRAPTELYVREQFLTPSTRKLISDPGIREIEQPMCGNQKVNEVNFAAIGEMTVPYRFSPFEDYVQQVMNDELPQAAKGARTLSKAFDRIQDRVVAYAKDQGFTVRA